MRNIKISGDGLMTISVPMRKTRTIADKEMVTTAIMVVMMMMMVMMMMIMVMMMMIMVMMMMIMVMMVMMMMMMMVMMMRNMASIVIARAMTRSFSLS